MANENQTDTTATQNSPTQATATNDAGQQASAGGSDATVSTGGDDAVDGDTTLVGGAKTAAGDGNAEAAKDGEVDADKGDSDEAGPPEAYDLKITTIDEAGKETQIELDAGLLEKATPLFKEVGLTNEQANKLAPLALEVQQRLMQQVNDEHSARIADWAKTVKADPEFGGAKWPQTEVNIDRALSRFGAPSTKDDAGNETNEFRALLNDSGLGNHPTVVKIFANIGAALGEDSGLVRTDATQATKKSPEQVMYPDDAPKT